MRFFVLKQSFEGHRILKSGFLQFLGGAEGRGDGGHQPSAGLQPPAKCAQGLRLARPRRSLNVHGEALDS